MAEYNIYPAVDENYQFPTAVREALATAPEILAILPAKVVIDPVNESAHPNGTIFYYTTA